MRTNRRWTDRLCLAVLAAFAANAVVAPGAEDQAASRPSVKGGCANPRQMDPSPAHRRKGSPDGEGTATFINPAVAQVGKPWAGDIEFTTGPKGLARCGGIRIFTPSTCWAGPPQVDKAVDVTPAPAPRFEVEVTSRQVQGWIVVVTFPDEPLPAGSKIRLHYSTPYIQQYSEDLVWPVESDVDGDGRRALLEASSLPRIHVTAGPPARLRIGAPSILEPGQEFTIRVLVMDELNNPIEQDFTEPVSLALGDSQKIVPIKGNRGEVVISAPAKEDLCHLIASAGGLDTCRLPVKVAASPSMKIYWGMLHAHTNQSDGLGTIDEYYTYGRDVGFLDVCAANDHAWQIDRGGTWQEYIAAADRYNEAGRYATLVGYEWTAQGHRNVYFATSDKDLPLLTMEKQKTYERFIAGLKRSGKRAIIGKHTAHPLDIHNHDPEFERLVEIQSMWGTSEYPGCPGWTKGAEEYVPAASGQTILALGHKIGFVGGGDSHSGRPGRNWYGTRWGPLLRGREGQTAILAPSLSRQTVFDALDQLHCYATSGPRILLHLRAANHVMGDSFEADRPRFLIEVGGTEEITRIDLLRDNGVISIREPKSLVWKGEIQDDNVPPGQHGYYLRVTQKDDERAWSTPVWITVR